MALLRQVFFSAIVVSFFVFAASCGGAVILTIVAMWQPRWTIETLYGVHLQLSGSFFVYLVACFVGVGTAIVAARLGFPMRAPRIVTGWWGFVFGLALLAYGLQTLATTPGVRRVNGNWEAYGRGRQLVKEPEAIELLWRNVRRSCYLIFILVFGPTALLGEIVWLHVSKRADQPTRPADGNTG
jgi:hypothetical protein